MNLHKEEVAIIMMALDGVIEDITESSKDVTMPFTPEARVLMRDMLNHAKSARAKVNAVSGGNFVALAPFKEGDAEEFFTKES